MLKNRNVAFLFILITILGTPTSSYAHDPEGMGRTLSGMFILSLIGAAVFLYFARKFVLRKTEEKSGTRVILVIASVLASFGVMFLLFFPSGYLVRGILIFYESEFYLRYGFLISLIFGIVFLYFAIKFVLRRTEGKRRIIKVVWMIGGVFASCVVALLGSPQYAVFNRTWTIPFVIEFCDGTHVEVQRQISASRYILFLPFGKDEKDVFKWTKNGKQFKRETWYYPMIINEYDGNMYVVEIDFGTSDFGKRDFKKLSSFKFYQFVGESCKEIEYTEFPKFIAYQNMAKYSTDISGIKKIDPKDYNFRHSYTGILWVQLETGEKMNIRPFGGSHNYSEALFVDFMEKYMKK